MPTNTIPIACGGALALFLILVYRVTDAENIVSLSDATSLQLQVIIRHVVNRRNTMNFGSSEDATGS